MTFFNREREWKFYMEEIFSRNNNLLIHNDVSLNGNLNLKNIITQDLSVNNILKTNNLDVTGNININENIIALTNSNISWDSFGTGNNHQTCRIYVDHHENVRTGIYIEGNGIHLISHALTDGSREYIYMNGPVRLLYSIVALTNSNISWDSFGTGNNHQTCFIGVALIEGRTKLQLLGNGIKLVSHVGSGGMREWIECFGPVYSSERFQTASGFNSDNYNSSDGRIKSREQPIINALETIKLITGKKYEYHPGHLVDYDDENSDLSGVEHSTKTGVIAQELLNIPELSHLVSSIKMPTHPNTSIYSVCYEGLIPYLIESIKEQQSFIQNQQTEINDLKAVNSLLKSKLNELLAEAGKETI